MKYKHKPILKGSDVGVLHLGLLSIWTCPFLVFRNNTTFQTEISQWLKLALSVESS
jgi:hypothetical protein